jgi:hypothetical protein
MNRSVPAVEHRSIMTIPPPGSSHWDTVLQLARTLPEVEEGLSYGTPALRVRGKFLARLRKTARRWW